MALGTNTMIAIFIARTKIAASGGIIEVIPATILQRDIIIDNLQKKLNIFTRLLSRLSIFLLYYDP